MKELLENIVKGIVNNPEEVAVVERESVDFPGLQILEISVSDADKGILIGKRGRTINAIRDIMTISAIRHDKRIKVLVKDDRQGGNQEEQSDRNQPKNSDEEDNSYNRVDASTEDMLNDEV